MVQAARSGRQNLAEGSVDSATSKKIEMKLTGVAKGSLEELKLDFEDFLRQRNLPQWKPDHPALQRFKSLRCNNLPSFRQWVADEVQRAQNEQASVHTDKHGQTHPDSSAPGRAGPCTSVSRPCSPSLPPLDLPSVLAANGALSLLNLCIHLVGKQLDAQAAAFEQEGGFTERLYRTRSKRRGAKP